MENKSIDWKAMFDDMKYIEEAAKDVKRSPDCCGCMSFPYALCGPCHRYNAERIRKESNV